MLAKLSVKKPYTVAVGVTLILILGIVSFSNMTTDLLPSMDLPFMIVSTPYPGASPEKVELSVTKPLEQALATTSGLERIRSVSSENVSMIMLEFNDTTNMDTVMIDVNGKIDQIEGNFEEGIATPIIIKMNPDMIPIMMLSIDIEDRSIEEVSEYVSSFIIPEFERIEGVASVEATGLLETHIRIQLDSQKIDQLNERVLALVDTELSEQASELNSAQKELQGMQSNLLTQRDKQIAQLEQVKQELVVSATELENRIAGVGVSREMLETTNKEQENLYLQNQTQITELEEALQKLSIDDPEYVIVENEKLELEAINRQIQQELDILEQAIGLFGQLDGLKEKEQQLDASIVALSNQFDSASQQFTEGEKQLTSARQELENARKIAYDNANINTQITPDMIANLLRAQNFMMPVGYLNEEDYSYLIKVGNPIESIETLEQLTLLEAQGVGTVKVVDVANVSFRDNSEDVYTNINGNPGVILTFQKASAYSTAGVTGVMRDKIEELSEENPAIKITTLSDQGIYIDMIIESVLNNLIYGGILAVIILWLFLRSVSTTLVVAFSIPISVLFSIVLMYFSGVTLNIISLSGLALGVGMLVDNSIVVVENIYRMRSQGASKKEAAIIGAQQVSGAIFASTLTTIAVFFPIVFASGITRELFVDMGLTIAYSLIASLIVAMTVVPAMSATVLTPIGEVREGVFYRFVAVYEKVLRQSLRYKWIVLSVALGIFLWTIYRAMTMGTSFMPPMDTTQMSLSFAPDEILTKEETREMSNTLIERLLTIEDIETVGALQSSGISMAGMSQGNDVTFYVILREDKQHSNLEVEEIILEKTKDLQLELDVSASTMDMSALSGSGIQVTIKGSEIDQLTAIAKEVGKMLQTIPGTKDVMDGMEATTTETRIVVNKNKAITYGLTTAQIYQIVANAIKEEENSASITIENKDYPVIVAKESTLSKDELMAYTFNGTREGETIELKLSDVTRLEENNSLEAIRHDQQTRYLTVSAMLDTGYNIGLVSRDVEKQLKELVLPTGYTVEIEGESENIQEAMGDLTQMLILAILFVYLIMVAQFQSLLSPFIVMFTIPLAFTGGLLALLITNQEISVISMLGFLVLAGVVVNNGIVFVDYVNQLRAEGKDKEEALIEAGKTRIRPILMTVLTTILAMSTMAIGVGMGSEMTQGLAIVSIGGLFYGTLLTLIVIPILYDLFNRKKVV